MSTDNILFIGGGAFEGLPAQVQRRLRPRASIGFRGETRAGTELSASHALAAAEPEDLRELGFIPEFIGRFPVFAALEELSEDALVRVLTEPRNALVRQYQALFEQSNAELEFSRQALVHMARQANQRGTGARGLRAILERLLMATMFDLPCRSTTRFSVTERDGALAIDAQEVERTALGAEAAPVRAEG